MAHALTSPGTRFRTALIALAGWLIVASLPTPAAAQPSPGARLVDYAAILLVPAELEAESMSGFQLSWSWGYMTISEAMAAPTYAESRSGIALADIPGAEAMLLDTGWQRFHETTLTRSRAEGPELAAFSVSSSVEAYATAEGAARAFEAFSDPGALNSGLRGEIALRPDAAPLGDQSVMWAVKGVAKGTGTPTTVLTRMVRVGSRIVSVNMVDFVDQAPIDPALLDRLTSRLLARLEQVGTTGQPCPPAGPTGIRAAIVDRTGLHLPGLSTCVLRLVPPDAMPTRGHYIVFDGAAIPLVRETPDAFAERQAEIDTLGQRDSYRAQFTIERGGNQAFYTVYIDRYVDEAKATAAFAGLEDRLRADTDRPLARFDAGHPAVGDASATYVRTDAASGNARTNSATRIGDIVVTVQISQTTDPLEATTQSLLLAQVGCMEANDCAQPVPVPPEVVPALAT